MMQFYSLNILLDMHVTRSLFCALIKHADSQSKSSIELLKEVYTTISHQHPANPLDIKN